MSPTQAPLRYNLTMKKTITVLLFSCTYLPAAPVAPGEYSIQDGNITAFIYPKNIRLNIAKTIHDQSGVMHAYAREFGYRLDRPLFQTLASSDDQIANAFSTQIPLNEQIFYGGGAGNYDTFASTSWLKTLQIHETAHNYQLGARENILSKIAHKLGGNVPFVSPLFVPMVPFPNITQDRFILEGNAVMNESRFGNGGRLYSGYALAETVTQARAGNLTPERMVNATLDFPGGEKFYLIGGHFQRFLVQRYGVRRVNGYFRAYARQPIPLFGNAVFREHYGKDFVTLMRAFGEQVLRDHRGFRPTRGQLLGTSQLRTPLSRIGDAVVTLTGDRRSAPRIVAIASGGTAWTQKGNWHAGRLFGLNGRYYTLASATVAPGTTKTGLFDRDGYLLPGTAGKAIQGRTADGRWVYFDVARSWEEPRLYVGDRFYGAVNSSVLVRGDDLYYFRQQGEQRTLYRNRTPLTSYRGHDGRVVDVDGRGRVYFIAPSRHGSTAYRVSGGRVERVSVGDDVIDLKLQGRNGAVVQTITAAGYALRSIRLTPRPAQVADLDPGLPTVRIGSGGGSGVLLPERPYREAARLRFSGMQSASSWSAADGYALSLEARFTDPLWRNTLSFVMRYGKERTLLRAAYANSAHALRYGGSVTAVVKHTGYDNSGYRDIGYSAYLSWPFLATGYWRGSMTLAAARPYDDPQRQPVSLSVGLTRQVRHGYSKYPNSYGGISGFLSYDRGEIYGGAKGAWMHDLGRQFFLGLRGIYLTSSHNDPSKAIGIKAGDTGASSADPGALNIPTLRHTYYLRQAAMGEMSLAKVLDISLYSYHLPLSLQRESLYLKQRIYRLDTGQKTTTLHESVVGIEADLLVLHRYTVPATLEVLYNPDIRDKVQIKAGVVYRF